MIPSKKLTAGNHVFYDGILCVVAYVQFKEVGLMVDSDVGEATVANCSDLDPIPLGKTILEHNGFELLSKGNGVPVYEINHKTRLGIWCKQLDKGIIGGSITIGDNFFPPIYHVHELENLFKFTNWGIELDIVL